MRELKVLTGRRVIVVTPDVSLEGVVESASRAAVTLCDARAVDGPHPVVVDGFVLVPVERISYVQVP